MTIQDAIARVAEGRDLSREEAAAVMGAIMDGEGSEAQIGGLLIGLRMKGEAVDEITGFAEAMRARATKVSCTRRPLVDTCGTGGDRSGTFNISTTAAFVVAGADVAVAKHGNRSASSQCGSADVLEALGVNLDLDAKAVGHCIDEIGIGFLFARALHPAMKHVAGARQALKTRTVFNFLGPLTNPAGATGQVVGVFDRERLTDLANVLNHLGLRRGFVVAGADHLDEITVSDTTYVAEVRDGAVSTYELEPGEIGIAVSDSTALLGGDAAKNAAILRNVLAGEMGPARDIVLLNAAAALQAGDAAEDWREGIARAQESIDSGAAQTKLDELIRFTTAQSAPAAR